MEREVDTSERSQGDAAEGAQPAAATPGEVDDRPAATPAAAADDAPAADAGVAAAAGPAAAAAGGAEAGTAEAGTDRGTAPGGDPAAVPASGARRKRVLTGSVVSDKGDRTIVVSIARRKKHRLYKKYVTLTRKLKAHDADNECRVGDLVRVVESRPLSREKRWRLAEIVKRAG